MKITIESDKKDGGFFYTLRKDGVFVLETSHWRQLTLPEILRGCADLFEYKALRLAAEFVAVSEEDAKRKVLEMIERGELSFGEPIYGGAGKNS